MKKGHEIKVSEKFIVALAIVSILGFIGIVSETLFERDISFYVESLWMIIIGLGFILEVRFRKLKSVSKGLSSNNFADLTTLVIGIIAVIAGVFSFPLWRIDTPGFLAIKGIVASIAILAIVIETWIVRS